MNTDVLSTGHEQDLYPKDESEHARFLSRSLEMFDAADAARKPLEDKWGRFYRLWRSHVKRRAGDWRSKVFLPHTFYIVDSIAPRMTASLPKMTAKPMIEDDAIAPMPGAKAPYQVFEDLLEYAADRCGLDMELVTTWYDALIYGTGIIKTGAMEEHGYRMVPKPVMGEPTRIPMTQPVIDPETGQQMRTPDGEGLTETTELELPAMPEYGPDGMPVMEMTREEVLLYRGPKAESVDPFNFWVAPEATSMQDARYAIQRYWRSKSYVEEQVAKGVYRWPDHLEDGDYGEAIDDPHEERLSDVGLSGGRRDPTRKAVELWEIWTEDLVITVGNRKAILRVAENPYLHGQIPYVRIVDHLVPHEFWGMGEVELVEGLQDLLNALVNQRIDNVRLLLNAMFIIDEDAIKDLRDLTMRPGGVIRAKDARAVGLDSLVKRLDMGEVTGSGFDEAAEAERLAEKFSGINGFTAGGDTLDSMNQTATGAAIISDSGNLRFMHKARIAEKDGYRRLSRQFGSLLQQFMPPEMVVRTQGEAGGFVFSTFTPESIQGGFDFDVEAESATTSETVRRDQIMALYDRLGQDPYINPVAIREDLLRVMGRKDTGRYIAPPQPPAVDPMTGQPLAPPEEESMMEEPVA